jgi:hypothetical protein
MSIEVIKQLVEVLDDVYSGRNQLGWYMQKKSIEVGRQAIAEAKKHEVSQEPVAKVCHDLEGHIGWNPSLTELPDEGVSLHIHLQPKREQDEAYKAAAYLAKAIFDSLYANKEPYVSGKVVWELCDTTVGVITQIDNMVSQFSPRHSQPKREWVELTDEEMRELEKQFEAERVRTSDEEYLVIYPADYWRWQRAIEAKLKEKNT